MNLEEKIEKMEKLLEEISKKVDSNILNKAKKYDETISLLEQINISANIEKKVDLDNGEDYLLVEYKIQPTKIFCDEDGNIEVSDKNFYSMNMLNILGINFMEEAQRKIEILKMSKK